MKKNIIQIVCISSLLLFSGCSLKTGYEVKQNESVYTGE